MTYTRSCKICGEIFQTTSHNRAVCYKQHTALCVVCGSQFVLDTPPYTQKTCSTKCKHDHMRMGGMKPRHCELCGEPFIPTSPRQKYCKRDHFMPCPVCGKPVLVDPVVGKPSGCSQECTNKIRSDTNVLLYGVPNAGALPEFVEKRQQTCLDIHGVKDYFVHPDFQDKSNETKLRKYGTTNLYDVPEIVAKREHNSMTTRGVKHHLQSKDVREIGRAHV